MRLVRRNNGKNYGVKATVPKKIEYLSCEHVLFPLSFINGKTKRKLASK